MPRVTPLKIAIVAAGVSHRQLADRIGCDERTISRWANGRQKPLPVYQQALADTLDQPVGDLFPVLESEAA